MTVRIGLIAHHAAPVATPFTGGLEAMFYYLARWLARAGCEVTVFAAPGTEIPGVNTIELDLDPALSQLARSDVSMPADRFIDAHYAYQRLMVDLAIGRHRFDVVHAHSLHYLPVAIGEILDTPTVLTLHSPPTPWLESALRMTRRPPWLVAVSRAAAEWWPWCDSVIPNGIDLDVWPAGAGGTSLVWTGRLVPEKAPHLALEAARRARRPIVLAGPRLDPRYFEAEVAPRLGPDAVYAGHLDHGPLGDLLARSSVLVQTPMWNEPFGLTAAEAMATGTPVASFARGGVAEVVGRAGGFTVDAGDVVALADAILAAERLPRAAVRADARERLGIERCGRAHLQLYRQLAAGRLPGRPEDDSPEADGRVVVGR